MVNTNNNRTRFLRGILFLKWIVTLLVWGAPALVGPPALFELLGVPFPDDPTFIRLFGAVVTALTLAYWYAWKDPIGNVAIIKFGILDNGLVTVTILFLGFTVELTSWFFWMSAILTTFFFVSFTVYIFMNKETKQG